ncbi:MAG: TIGR00341 family protein [Actinomycetia bacterium]|nr:TIGR00341 family protein [Actinomycetes bacterium]
MSTPNYADEGSALPVGVPLSDNERLWWFNWTTIRGAALVLAGVVIMVTPERDRVVSLLLAAGLIVWAASEVWFALLRRRRPPEAIAQPDRETVSTSMLVGRTLMVVALVAGALLLLLDEVGFTLVIGVVLVLRGVVSLARVTRQPHHTRSRRDQALLSLLLMIVGGVTIVVPTTAVLALRAGLGIGAMALGGILISMGTRRGAGHVRLRFDHSSAPTLVNDWLVRRRLSPKERGDLVETLFFEPPKRVAKLASFWVMMVLATGIASFAIIQDSTAVVIGAMLVAPLMTPIMGVSAAAVNGWAKRLARSILLVLVAAAAAVFVAWLIASWLPSVGPIANNSQITSRVEPSLLDFCIAIFAGAAGAYATVDPRVSSSLSGVAVAVALVPPLGVVGITLQAGQYEWALGALLLFTTNVVSIVLAAVTVFVLMGFAAFPPDETQRSRLSRVISVFGAGALVILVPLSFTSQDLWNEASDEAKTSKVVLEWLPDDTKLELVTVESEGNEIEVVLTGPRLPENTDDLMDDLTEELGYRPTIELRLVPSQITELD